MNDLDHSGAASGRDLADSRPSSRADAIRPLRSPFQPDPYRPFREAGHVVTTRGQQVFPLVVNFDEVRRIARDWPTYTSDTPFEVPIPHEHDARSVRQLPIETDPPRHSSLRALTEATFSRKAVEAHAPIVASIVDEALELGMTADRFDVIADLALPTVNYALAAAIGLPASDVPLWLTWGTHVFLRSGTDTKASNPQLDSYLESVVDAAMAGDGQGLFAHLAAATVGEQQLTREELLGFANLLFAGGRDTVVGGIATSFVVLASLPDALRWLRDDPGNAKSAVEEILRIQSPLSYIGRHATMSTSAGGCPVDTGDLLALGFGAANRDPAAFEDADSCRLDRKPNRQIAFGHGPHTCLGAHLARMEMRVTLERVAQHVTRIELSEPVRERHLDVGGQKVLVGFDNVIVELSR